ncbi:sulfatase family protein [Cerasicoccus frondis]|uniref:sulfatase family protein n=1 Tax=Cerasicoccus frondis TaxID=490090 RepID=UPI0028527C1A|nr:sulfatase-like hydrolase/transferase [Cerasicoccus frondis]
MPHVYKQFGALIFLMLSSIAAAQIPARPNVVLIMADDLSRDEVGAYGGRTLTPHIDQLAESGQLFTQAYTVVSVCSPSRYTTLTGRFPGRCTHPEYLKRNPPGAINRPSNRAIELERDRPNLMKALQANGYVTGLVGKWHLGEWMCGWQVDGEWKFPPGFYAMGLQAYSHDASFDDPEFNQALRHNQEIFREELQADGWDEAAAIYWANPRELHHDQLNNHNVEWLTHAAVEFIQRHQGEPFFLYLASTIPHVPEPIETLKRGDDPRLTGEGVTEKHLGVQPARADVMARVQAAGLAPETAPITWLDDGVGAVMQTLEDSGLAANTVVIFTSDHGLPGKATLYQDGVWIPLVISGAGIPEGIENLPVQLTDLTPTILDLTDTPPQSDLGVDGRSLTSLWRDKDASQWHDDLYFEYGYARAVIHDDWKYIAVRYPEEAVAAFELGETEHLPYLGTNSSLGAWQARRRPDSYYVKDQLYNLAQDPEEKRNLANDPRYSKVLAEMQKRLSRYLATYPERPFGELHLVEAR